ncbi:hypothetical protein [Maribacter forsetii]|uniref:hypothetical protein n=1 Tax=Maribacter forsetii TaxID=444515 RepID=UPI000564C207|nr:hypothetical protein [Maribacter forsetii]
MIDGLSFAQKELLIPVVLGGLLVFVAFIFKEWKTRNKGRFVFNSIVAFLTVLALVLIVLEPTKEVKMQDQQGLLLTDGFNEKQKDSLEAVFKGIQPIEYNPKKSVRKALDSLTSAIVIGNGVEEFDFYAFDSLPTTYVPSEIPSGITLLNFTNQLVLGDELRVKGMYSKPKLSAQLVLQDSRGNGLDSIPFKEKSNHHFSLKTVPKACGNFVYQLAEKDSVGKLLASNPLPITIREKEPVSILIINNFPTFETKYLKNFLADAGYEVTVRSQLTKGKYKFEYFNTKASPVYQFTEESLNQFNVVIADTETYFNFGKSVKNRFENSIRENGLGLFIQPSERLFNLGVNTSYFSFKRDGRNEIQLSNSNITVEKYPFRFSEAFAVNPINANEFGNLSYYKQLGLGRVATATLTSSYQLLLKGEEQAYSRIWTQILDKIVKQKALAVEWKSQTELPIIGAPFNFELRTGLEELSIKNTEGNRVPLLQNSTVPFKYSGTTYPKKKGWNRLRIETDSTLQFSYYVYDDKDWKSLSASKNRVANAKQFGTELKENRTVMVNRPISLLLFYILFLLGIGWLWLSPKLSAQS